MIGIRWINSISSWGEGEKLFRKGWEKKQETLADFALPEGIFPAARYTGNALEFIGHLYPKYKSYDRMALMALWLADQLLIEHPQIQQTHVPVFWGTARGATESWEENHIRYLRTGVPAMRTSPLTTFGFVSSQVARHLRVQGAFPDLSVTCGSGLFTVLQAAAWLGSGMAETVLCGASEAPLTGFTIGQMRALGIYSQTGHCEPFGQQSNTMVLGEGGAALLAEKPRAGIKYRAYIRGWGNYQEVTPSLTGTDPEGTGFRKAMEKAIQVAGIERPDKVFAHAPGTLQGDHAEWQAIQSLWPENTPGCESIKQYIGHTLGASGLLSLQAAVLWCESNPGKTALINGLGFGGNAISLVVGQDFA